MFFSLHHAKGNDLHPTTLLCTNVIFNMKIIEGFLVPSLSLMLPVPPKSHWKGFNSELFKELSSWSFTSRFLMLGSPPSPLEGQVLSDGKVFIHLCNYIEPWENLSFLQRESLNHHYHLNCGCQVRDVHLQGLLRVGKGLEACSLTLHVFFPSCMHLFTY